VPPGSCHSTQTEVSPVVGHPVNSRQRAEALKNCLLEESPQGYLGGIPGSFSGKIGPTECNCS
jgi:hypothetical protein